MATKHSPAPIYDHILRFQRQPKLQPSQVAEAFEQGRVYVLTRPDWYWRWVRRDKVRCQDNVAARVAAKRERQLSVLVAAVDRRAATVADRREANRERRALWAERRRAR